MSYPLPPPSCVPYPSLLLPVSLFQPSCSFSPALDPTKLALMRQTMEQLPSNTTIYPPNPQTNLLNPFPLQLLQKTNKLMEENMALTQRLISCEQAQAHLNSVRIELNNEKQKTQLLLSENEVLKQNQKSLLPSKIMAKKTAELTCLRCEVGSLHQQIKKEREKHACLLEQANGTIKSQKEEIENLKNGNTKKERQKRKFDLLEKENSNLSGQLSDTQKTPSTAHQQLGVTEALLGIATDQEESEEEEENLVNGQIQEQVVSISNQIAQLREAAKKTRFEQKQIYQIVLQLTQQPLSANSTNPTCSQNQPIDPVEKYLA